MPSDVLIIKNMVCPRCVEAVKAIFSTHGYPAARISLGKAELSDSLTDNKKKEIAESLRQGGFELLDDPKAKLVSDIKRLVIERVRKQDGPPSINLSTYLANELHKDFSALSRLFSGVEGMTLERYVLKVRTEYVKELLFYDELTLSEIAFRLGYSSTAHLSSQFRKETGMTPTRFKNISDPVRNPLDSL